MTDSYKHIAAWYDRLFEPSMRGLWKTALNMCPPQTGMKVLDIGCGTGAFLGQYQKAGCRVFGIDMSPAMLIRARQKLGCSANLIFGHAAEPPLRRRAFDLIMLAFVLHEMPERVRHDVILSSEYLLKENGRLILIDYHAGPSRGAKGRMIQYLLVAVERAAGKTHFKNYRNYMRNRGLKHLLCRGGLRIEKIKIVADGNIAIVAMEPNLPAGEDPMEVKSGSSEYTPVIVSLRVDESDLAFSRAAEIARAAARQRAPNAMMLSWNDRDHGEFYPRFDCGSHGRPAWIVFAESRGANLTVDINDGAFTFMFLAM